MAVILSSALCLCCARVLLTMATGGGVPMFSGRAAAFVERLESYFVINGTKDDKKQHVLVMGLTESQYDTLSNLTAPDKPMDKTFAQLRELLVSHFDGATNKMVERAKFREVKRGKEETVVEFLARLRAQARACDFGATLDENLVEQFCIGVNSRAMRDRIGALPGDKQVVLKELVQVAQQVEIDEKLDGLSVSEPETVSALTRSVQARRKEGRRGDYAAEDDRVCFRCNRKGHISSSKRCPATNRKCNTCNEVGHFSGSRFCKRSKPVVSAIEGETEITMDNTTDEEGLFNINQIRSTMPRCTIKLMGYPLSFILDTGACNNVIDLKAYQMIKDRVRLQHAPNELFAYGSDRQLPIIGKFNAKVECKGRFTDAVFYVYEGSAKCLLSSATASALSLLSFSNDVNMLCNIMQESYNVVKRFPEVFKGVGKLRGYKVNFHIDKNVSPVAQPVRRLPLCIRAKVKAKIDELVANDIIEPVVGVRTSWMSPLVAVIQDNGDVRQTVDMRRANEAILRERHPIPTTKEILASIEGSRFFSKLDLKQGFHQVELAEESREITTFISPFGVYRYKRLTMGVNASPEHFQYIIQQALAGLEGVQNMADDILLYADSIEEHDKCLDALMKRLSEVGLTLNPKKCIFRTNSVKFLGYIVSDKGLSPDPEKVEAL